MSSYSIQPADQRFTTKIGWLNAKHSFNFGNHYSPEHNGHGLLLVSNDDVIAPGHGFPMHQHRDMEIVTWVLSGSLEHKDSAGNEGLIVPGLAQRMSAGSGIFHSEINASQSEELHLVQMWVLPDRAGITPSYEQLDLTAQLQTGELIAVASGQGHEGAVALNQNAAVLWAQRPQPDSITKIPSAEFVHLFVAAGSGTFSIDGQDHQLSQGDAVRISGPAAATFSEAAAGSELLIWQMSESN